MGEYIQPNKPLWEISLFTQAECPTNMTLQLPVLTWQVQPACEIPDSGLANCLDTCLYHASIYDVDELITPFSSICQDEEEWLHFKPQPDKLFPGGA